MRISVRLSDDNVAFLDAYAGAHGLASRSAALREALRLLKASELGTSYEDAWRDWETAGENDGWDRVLGDGLADAPR